MLHFRDYAQLCRLGALCFKYYSFTGASKICTLYLCYFKQFRLIASCSSIKVISWLLIAVTVFSPQKSPPLFFFFFSFFKSGFMHIQDFCMWYQIQATCWIIILWSIYCIKMCLSIFNILVWKTTRICWSGSRHDLTWVILCVGVQFTLIYVSLWWSCTLLSPCPFLELNIYMVVALCFAHEEHSVA